MRAACAATVAALALAAAGCGGSGGGCTFRRPSAQDAEAIRTAIRRYDRRQTPIKRERITDIRVAARDANTASAGVEILFPPAQGVQALVLRKNGVWHVFAEGPNLLANIENQTQAMTDVLSDEGVLC